MAYRVVDPFNALREFQQALDTRRESDWFARGTTGTGTYPAVNVFSKDDDFVVVAELPGVDKEVIGIDVKGDQVRIKGAKDITFSDDVSVHRRERRSGKFDRTLTIPVQIDVDQVKAEYNNGILVVLLPRAEADKPKAITIN